VRAKAINWLNAAYMEVLNELLLLAPQSLQRIETVGTDSTGQATLSLPPFALVRVLWGAVPLAIVNPLTLLEADPTATIQGTPALACATTTGLRVQPRAAGSATVVYTPKPIPLAEDGPEASILLPPAFHDALVWGGLVWSALFERGLGSSAELQLFSRQWAEARARLKLHLMSQAGVPLRVAAGDY